MCLTKAGHDVSVFNAKADKVNMVGGIQIKLVKPFTLEVWDLIDARASVNPTKFETAYTCIRAHCRLLSGPQVQTDP